MSPKYTHRMASPHNPMPTQKWKITWTFLALHTACFDISHQFQNQDAKLLKAWQAPKYGVHKTGFCTRSLCTQMRKNRLMLPVLLARRQTGRRQRVIFDSAQCRGWEQVLSVTWMDIQWIQWISILVTFIIYWIFSMSWVWEFSRWWMGTSFDCCLDGYPLDILNILRGYS